MKTIHTQIISGIDRWTRTVHTEDGRLLLDKSDHPELKPGDSVTVQLNPEDQFAKIVLTLTVAEAFKAFEHAEETISGCEGIDELDEASDVDECAANCPEEFNEAQRDLAQQIILQAYMKAIGRA